MTTSTPERTDFYTPLKNITVAQLLIKYLENEGVDKIFGIPGGALIFLINELRKPECKIDFVICRQETGAAYIADGYARATGGLGVVMTTSGPAATNAVTGMMNAQASFTSLLAITGEIPEPAFGRGYLQEGIDSKLDVNDIYKNSVNYSAVISSSSNFQSLFQQALRDARSIPNQASHVSIPVNVENECYPTVNFPKNPAYYRSQAYCTDEAGMRRAFDSLISADKPVIFLGNGARKALEDNDRLEAFTAMVETFGIPIMTTPDAKGIFPETHDLSLRNYGMSACKWSHEYVRTDNEQDPQADPNHYDVLMIMGSTMGELATSVYAKFHWDNWLIPRREIIQVDLDASTIGRNYPVTQGIVSEISAALDAMIAYSKTITPDEEKVAKHKAVVAEIKERVNPFDFPKERASDAAPVHPAAVVRVVSDTLAAHGSGHIFIDAGNCVGWSLNNLVIDPPVRCHSALTMGPMGFGVCAVIGGKAGDPNAPSVGIVGDGAFMMQGSEISTAAQNGIGAIWVVLNDNDLSMVSQGMAELFPQNGPWEDYYKLGAPDLVKYSEGLGADAVAVCKKDGIPALEAALHEAIKNADERKKPQVIVAHINTKDMPLYGWPKAPAPNCG